LKPFFFFENNIGDLEQISKKCQDTIACYLRIFIILYADDTVILSESAEGLQKKNTGFTQTSYSLYLISIYFDYLLGLNKIPCLLYEQLFIYTTIWLKRNILLGSILRLSYYLLCLLINAIKFYVCLQEI
jgi:hypothetical protein